MNSEPKDQDVAFLEGARQAFESMERLRELFDAYRASVENVLSCMAEILGRSSGVVLIMSERARQMEEEGYDHAHDDSHSDGRLADVAGLVAQGKTDPWLITRMHADDRVRQLVISGALIAAEIDRLLRLEAASPENDDA